MRLTDWICVEVFTYVRVYCSAGLRVVEGNEGESNFQCLLKTASEGGGLAVV